MTSQTASSSRPLPAALNLEGKRVVVTGAANGIGQATARAAAELGAALVLCDRDSLAAARAEIEAMGASVETVEGDLTAKDTIDRLMSFGPVYGVAHCAGILSRVPLNEDPDSIERFHRTMDVNVRVPVDIGTAFTDHMAANGGGRIVMIGSVAGRTGGTSMSTPIDYSASKGAVHVVIRWLSRRAVSKGVQINGIAPGPIKTAMTAGNTTDPSSLPSGRMGEPEEMAWMIMMLLTPAASYVSGAVLDCNGGSYVG
jgi:NAD(P)-dependent dehydrogenase (short-subunit alcohol dehydrogenase family)